MTGLGMSGHVFNYAEASFQDVPINEATVISRLNPRSVTACLCLLGALQNKFSGRLKSILFMVSEVPPPPRPCSRYFLPQLKSKNLFPLI